MRANSKHVSDALRKISKLMRKYHAKDIEMQESLSILVQNSSEFPSLSKLQHADLLAQVHLDLSNLLTQFSNCLDGHDVSFESFASTLTLQSLRDSILYENGQVDIGELAHEDDILF